MEEESYQGKKVRFDDWMGSEEPLEDGNFNSLEAVNSQENFNKIFAHDKFSKRAKKGHLKFLMQNTYGGDDRFNIEDKAFDVDEVKKLPSNLLGRMSTREIQDLITEKSKKKAN